MQVSHRQTLYRSNGIIGLPDRRAGLLIQSAEGGLAGSAFAREEQRFRDEKDSSRVAAGSWNIHAGECGIVLDYGRRIPIRNHPRDFAFVHVVRSDAPIWRLQQRQALNPRHTGTAAHGVIRCHEVLCVRVRLREPGQRRTGVRTNIDETRFRIRSAGFPVRTASKAGQHNRAFRFVRRIGQRRRCVDGTDAKSLDGLKRLLS